MLFSPYPALENQPKNGATPSVPSSSCVVLLLLFFFFITRAHVSRRGNLASSQNRAELIGKLQGSAVEPIQCLFLIFSRTLRRPSPTPLSTSQRRRRRRQPQVRRKPRQRLLRGQRRRRRIHSHVRRRRETSPHRSLRSFGSARVSVKNGWNRRDFIQSAEECRDRLLCTRWLVRRSHD